MIDTILEYKELHLRKNKVNLHYYHPELSKDFADVNLGDSLSPVIVEWMLNSRGLSLDCETSSTKNLYALGSILSMGMQDTTVWGTGFPYDLFPKTREKHTFPNRKLDIRCVRGPKTRETLLSLGYDCPPVYGDPAILMPLIYMPDADKNEDIIVIPHMNTEMAIRKLVPDSIIVSMQTNNFKPIIDRICSARYVVSSSLHGIILAEAYGIPAVFFQDREDALNYKYEDWYLSTNRPIEIFSDLNNAFNAVGRKTDIPDLSTMRRNLIDSFPFDLWEE